MRYFIRFSFPSFLADKLILLTAGCAQNALFKNNNNQSGLNEPDEQARLQQGLQRYRDSRYDAARDDLSAAVASGRLKNADEINARKHMAFIHCVSNREAQCREQFQAILKTDAHFDLAPNEANHPGCGPVWRSTMVAVVDQLAVSRGSGLQASAGMQKLAD